MMDGCLIIKTVPKGEKEIRDARSVETIKDFSLSEVKLRSRRESVQ